MTDDVIEGKIEESQFRRAAVWLVGSRLARTVIAQFFAGADGSGDCGVGHKTVDKLKLQIIFKINKKLKL